MPEFLSDYPQMALPFLAWTESEQTVDGPYMDGYYVFTAKPDMKLVIVTFEFRNNWIRAQDFPCFSGGGAEITTHKGYIYELWSPPSGIHSEEYSPRPSTLDEIKAFSGPLCFEDLLPEDSGMERITFEIPDDETPLEVHLFGAPYTTTLSLAGSR